MSGEATILSGRVSKLRRAKNTIFTASMGLCVVLALTPLTLIVGYVMVKGWSALSVNLFTKEPAGPLSPSSGGIVQSFIGSGMIVGIAVLLSVPLGILTAVYLSEF